MKRENTSTARIALYPSRNTLLVHSTFTSSSRDTITTHKSPCPIKKSCGQRPYHKHKTSHKHHSSPFSFHCSQSLNRGRSLAKPANPNPTKRPLKPPRSRFALGSRPIDLMTRTPYCFFPRVRGREGWDVITARLSWDELPGPSCLK